MGKQSKKRKQYLRLHATIHQLDYRSVSWYHDARELIVREYGKQSNLFCGLLAATSPRKQVVANFRLANRLIKTYNRRMQEPKAFGDILGSLMPAHLVNVIRALRGESLSGNKVKAFFQNLTGNLSVVTIDTWIAKAYGIDAKSLSDVEYARLSFKMSREAKVIGLEPAEYQALVWTSIRRESGKAYKSFVAAWYDVCQPTFWDLV